MNFLRFMILVARTSSYSVRRGPSKQDGELTDFNSARFVVLAFEIANEPRKYGLAATRHPARCPRRSIQRKSRSRCLARRFGLAVESSCPPIYVSRNGRPQMKIPPRDYGNGPENQ